MSLWVADGFPCRHGRDFSGSFPAYNIHWEGLREEGGREGGLITSLVNLQKHFVPWLANLHSLSQENLCALTTCQKPGNHNKHFWWRGMAKCTDCMASGNLHIHMYVRLKILATIVLTRACCWPVEVSLLQSKCWCVQGFTCNMNLINIIIDPIMWTHLAVHQRNLTVWLNTWILWLTLYRVTDR